MEHSEGPRDGGSRGRVVDETDESHRRLGREQLDGREGRDKPNSNTPDAPVPRVPSVDRLHRRVHRRGGVRRTVGLLGNPQRHFGSPSRLRQRPLRTEHVGAEPGGSPGPLRPVLGDAGSFGGGPHREGERRRHPRVHAALRRRGRRGDQPGPPIRRDESRWNPPVHLPQDRERPTFIRCDRVRLQPGDQRLRSA